MKDQEKVMLAERLESCKAEAEEMGITLQEYLLLCILEELEQFPHRGT